MNTLTKNQTSIVTIPGSPGVPGNPGRPAVPARCWVETYTETVPVVSNPVAWEPQNMDLDGDGYPDAMGGDVGFGVTIRDVSIPNVSFQTVTRSRTVCSEAIPAVPATPAIPPTPAQTLVAGGIGWNARARSRDSAVGGFNIRFEVPVNSVGVIVGVTGQDQADSGYADVLFGLLVERGQARVMVGPAPGAVVPHGVFGLRMVNGVLDVLVDGVVEHSASVAYNPSQRYWMTAALYAGGDQVLNAEFLTAGGTPDPGPYVEGGENLALLAPLIGVGYAEAALLQGGTSRLRPLSAEARMAARGWGYLSELDVFGGAGPYGEGISTLAPLGGGGTGPGFITPAFAYSIGYLSPLTGLGGGSTGGFGEGESRLLPLTGLGGDHVYGQGRSLLAPLLASAGVIPADEAFLISRVTARAPLAAGLVLFVAFTSSLQVAAVVEATVTQDAQVLSGLSVSTSMGSAADLEAVIHSVLGLPVFQALESGEQWAVTDGKQASRYVGYGFNSFATINGKHYGAKKDGIYLLEGASDAGVQIDVGMVLGKLDFGTAKLKRVENVYVGVSTTKTLYLKVTAEGQTFTYQARSVSNHLQQQRFDPGKGLRANFFEFELIGKGQVELSGVEFRAVPLSRRI